MLIVIDCGNTNIVFAVYKDKELIGKWRTATNAEKTSDDYSIWLEQILRRDGVELNNINDVIISSVVPNKNEIFKRLCLTLFKLEPSFIGDSNVKTDLMVLIDNPSELGADRVVNAIAAYNDYPGPIIIVDFGTATTFDIIDNTGSYLGGVIAPGINLSLDALHMSTALLPRISMKTPKSKSIIGKSTISAMNAGIYWGYIGLIEGIINKIREELMYKDFKIIATGGLANFFSKATDLIDKIDDDLTLRGLMIVYQKNKK